MANKTENRSINMYVNGKQVGNDINSIRNAYRNVAREVNKLDRNSDEYRRGVKKLSSLKGEMKRHGDAVRGVESRWTKLSSTVRRYSPFAVGALAGAAIVGAFRAAARTITEFQDANAKLNAVLGTTTEETKVLRDQQLKLGSSTAFTAGQAADAQTELAKLGFTMGEIANLTPAVLDLAAASGTDLPNAAAIAGSTLRQFGMDSSETQRVVDVMAKSFSSSALDIQKFQVAMAAAGPVAAAAGVSFERTTALIGVLADRGLDASTAGTSLRNIFLDIAAKGLTFEEAMNKINTATDKNVAALDLFGKRGATAAVIMAENAEAAAKLETALNSAAGAAKEMAEKQLDTLTGDLTKLTSAWEGLILSIENGEGALGRASRSFTQWVTDVVSGMSTLNRVAEESEKSWLELITVTSTGKVGIAELFTDTSAILKNPLRLFGIDRIGWDRELLDLSNSIEVWSTSAKEAYAQQKITDGNADLKYLQDLRGEYLENEAALRMIDAALTELEVSKSDGLSSALSFLNDPSTDPAATTDPDGDGEVTDEQKAQIEKLGGLIKSEREKLAKEGLVDREKEILATQQHFSDLIIQAKGYGEQIVMLKRLKNQSIDLINQEWDEKERKEIAKKADSARKKIDEALLQDQAEIVQEAAKYDELIALAQEFGYNTEEIERSKALALQKIRLKDADHAKQTADKKRGDEMAAQLAVANIGFSILNNMAQAQGESAAYQQELAMFQNLVNGGLAISQAASSVKAADPITYLALLGTVVGVITSTLGQARSMSESARPPAPPAFATGTDNAPGGMSLVGERGPELVNLPAGSQVMPAGPSRNLMFGPNALPDFGGVPDLSGRSGGQSSDKMMKMLGQYMKKQDDWARNLTVIQKQTGAGGLDEFNERYQSNLKRVRSSQS